MRHVALSGRLLFTAMVSLVLLSGLRPARADVYHSPLDPSAAGGIRGKITPAEGLERVIVLEPFAVRAYEASLNAGSGEFTIKGLPPGEYDLIIKATGKVYEGVTLEVESQQPASAADLAQLSKEVGEAFFGSEPFFNVKRIVRLTGTGEQARMLAIQWRTKATLDPAGNPIAAVIRRIDFVDLVKTRKVWQIATSRHLLRQEVPHGSPDTKLSVTYSPKLGGILVGESVADLGDLDLTKLPAVPPGKYAAAEWEEREEKGKR